MGWPVVAVHGFRSIFSIIFDSHNLRPTNDLGCDDLYRRGSPSTAPVVPHKRCCTGNSRFPDWNSLALVVLLTATLPVITWALFALKAWGLMAQKIAGPLRVVANPKIRSLARISAARLCGLEFLVFEPSANQGVVPNTPSLILGFAERPENEVRQVA